MVEADSVGLITWNWGLLRGGTTHVNLWSNSIRERNHRLGLWGYFLSWIL